MCLKTKVSIYDIFAYYQEVDFYYRNIPERLLSYINKKYNIPTSETVIAFLHCRFNTGVCFTEKGAYWKLVGQRKGTFSWEFLKGVTHIKVEKDTLYLDNKKTFMLAGTTYPQSLLVQLLEEIKKNSIENQEHYSKINNKNNTLNSIDDVLRVCSTFKGDNDCLVCNILNVDIKTEDSISDNTKKALRTKNNLGEFDTLIAYVNTYMGIGTNGIVITDKGVCFSREYLSLNFPWHIFKKINLVYNNQKKELLINDRNIMNLSCSIIDGQNILLFLQQLQKKV